MPSTRLSAALLAALGLTLAACATSKPPKLAICDANPKHRRDANPYGSVLPGAPSRAPALDAAPPMPPPVPAPGTPAPQPAPPAKTSAIGATFYFASC